MNTTPEYANDGFDDHADELTAEEREVLDVSLTEYDLAGIEDAGPEHAVATYPPEYTVGGEDRPPRNVMHADARNRGFRTLVQGGAVAVGVAAVSTAAVFLGGVSEENIADAGWWIGGGILVGQTALTALTSYVQRRIEESRNRRDAWEL